MTATTHQVERAERADRRPPAGESLPARWFDDWVAAAGWLGGTFSYWADALPDDEHAAVCAYKDDGHRWVNTPLRAEGRLSAGQKRQVMLLDRALGRFSLPEAVVVYRGFHLSGRAVVGARIEDQAFVSTSLMRNHAEEFLGIPGEQPFTPVLARVLLPAGTRCGAPDLVSYLGEVEILVARGSAFVVRAAQAPSTRSWCWRLDLEAIV